tara:strand:+ start:250 stop:438 length:189 start_codon:yes stop_codon:yes gene_type:complete
LIDELLLLFWRSRLIHVVLGVFGFASSELAWLQAITLWVLIGTVPEPLACDQGCTRWLSLNV